MLAGLVRSLQTTEPEPPDVESSLSQIMFPDASVVSFPPFVYVEQSKSVNVIFPDDPFVKVIFVFEELFPIEILLSFAPVPIFKFPVVPESTVKAVALAEERVTAPRPV